jgi:hypothetical protein
LSDTKKKKTMEPQRREGRKEILFSKAGFLAPLRSFRHRDWIVSPRHPGKATEPPRRQVREEMYFLVYSIRFLCDLRAFAVRSLLLNQEKQRSIGGGRGAPY